MGDDVLGHDHLDHGKHLHKGGHSHHGPHRGKRPVRDTRLPHHVGVLPIGKADDHGHTGGHRSRSAVHWKVILVCAAVIAPILVTFYHIFTALALTIIILGLDVLIELHKWYTEGMPLDLEILSVGIAYMTAVYSFGWGMLLAILGPIVVGMSHQEFSEGAIVRLASYIAVAIAAAMLGAAPIALFTAVLIGLGVRGVGSAYIVQRPLLVNVGGRLSTAFLAAVIIFGVLPQV